MTQSNDDANQMTVEVRQFAPQDYLGEHQRVALEQVGKSVQSAFNDIFQALAASHSDPAGPPFLIASQPERGEMEVEVGVPCAQPPETDKHLHAGHLPGGKAAVYVYKGPYEGIGEYYSRLANWIARSGHHAAGDPREVYLTDPSQVADPSQHVTELVWPID